MKSFYTLYLFNNLLKIRLKLFEEIMASITKRFQILNYDILLGM